MKRLLLALAVAALAAAPPALAKHTSLRVAGPPAHAARTWQARIVVSLDGRPLVRPRWQPQVWLLDRAGSIVGTFSGRATAKPGVYVVPVRFPRAGLWRYEVPDPVMGGWYFTVRVRA